MQPTGPGPMTPADLARLTDEERRSVELAEATTEGPWVGCAHVSQTDADCPCGFPGDVWDASEKRVICTMGSAWGAPEEPRPPSMPDAQKYADGRFIADARTAVPHLAAEVARLRGERLELIKAATLDVNQVSAQRDARDAAIRALLDDYERWPVVQYKPAIQRLRALVTPGAGEKADG